jgi:ketosteroid isomerase-like protein
MSETDNVHAVRQIFDAFSRGDIPALLALLDEKVEWAIPGPSSIPHAGKAHGKKGVADFLKRLSESTDLTSFAPAAFIAESNHVVVLGHESGKSKPLGRTYENPWAMVFTFKGGLVAGFREYIDTAAVAEAFKK